MAQPPKPTPEGAPRPDGAPPSIETPLRESFKEPSHVGSLLRYARAPSAPRFFFFLLIASGAAVLYLLFDFVHDAILAFLFTGLSAPLYRRILKRTGGRTWIGAGLICVLLVMVVAGPVTLLVTSLSSEAATLFVQSRESVTIEHLEVLLFGDGLLARNARRIALSLGVTYSPETMRGALEGVVGGVAKYLYAQANTLLSNVFKFVFHFIIVLLLLFYLLAEGEDLKHWFFRLSPLPDDEDDLLVAKFKAVGRGILVGNLVSGVIQGSLGGVAMYFAGLPSPVLWGTVMSMFAFLPVVGINAVTIPAALFLCLRHEYLAAAIFYGFCLFQAFFVENVLKTRLIGSHIELHGVLIFLSILGGIGAFGMLGLLYGPLLVVLFLTFAELYEARYQHRPL